MACLAVAGRQQLLGHWINSVLDLVVALQAVKVAFGHVNQMELRLIFDLGERFQVTGSTPRWRDRTVALRDLAVAVLALDLALPIEEGLVVEGVGARGGDLAGNEMAGSAITHSERLVSPSAEMARQACRQRDTDVLPLERLCMTTDTVQLLPGNQTLSIASKNSVLI